MLTEPVTAGRYRTRSARVATVLCNDAPGQYSCVGYVIELIDGKPLVHTKSWRADGSLYIGRQSLDLIERIGDLP